jgi:hypothetical protein
MSMNDNASTISKQAVGMHWREHYIHDAYIRRALQLYTIKAIASTLLKGDTYTIDTQYVHAIYDYIQWHQMEARATINSMCIAVTYSKRSIYVHCN